MHPISNLARPLGRGLALAALAALASIPLKAQDQGWYGGFKVRAGYRMASQQDNLSGSLLGFGVAAGCQLPQGTFEAELNYSYLPGSQALVDPAAGSPSGVVVDPTVSVDSRKNQLQGLTLRLAYEKPWGDLGLRLGLQVGSLQFRQEYLGDISGTTGGKPFADTYNGVNAKGSMSVSPFLGIAFPIGTDQRLEVQVLALGYKATTYRHVQGSVADENGGHTAQDAFVDVNRRVPHLEVTYALHF
jgi:hypothetical protein